MQKNDWRIKVFLWVTLVLTIQPAARADDVYNIVIKKQDDKQSTRWSLADWLDTRDRMRVQDLWLAMHSPSPYEFYVGGNYQFNSNSGSGYPLSSFNAWSANVAAYASIIGVEGQYESNPDNRWYGWLNFRIFGYHHQATNITLQAGLRDDENGTYGYRSIFLGADLTLYFMKFFGIEGVYRHFFTSTPTPVGNYSSDRIEGGAFIDFSFFRLFGNYFWEPYSLSSLGGSSGGSLSGIIVGGKIFF